MEINFFNGLIYYTGLMQSAISCHKYTTHFRTTDQMVTSMQIKHNNIIEGQKLLYNMPPYINMNLPKRNVPHICRCSKKF